MSLRQWPSQEDVAVEELSLITAEDAKVKMMMSCERWTRLRMVMPATQGQDILSRHRVIITYLIRIKTLTVLTNI